MTAWQARIEVPKAAVDAVEALFTSLTDPENPPALSSFALGFNDKWRVDAIFPDGVDQDALKNLATEALSPLGLAVDALSMEPVAAIDWVEESLKHHQPVRAGRFFVHGSHHTNPANPRTGILIDANVAFGTGQHETTFGCLQAIDTLAKAVQPKSVLDVGCGTGILSIAAAKAWPKFDQGAVLATDIDADAIRVTNENARQNGVRAQISGLVAAGLDHPDIRNRSPFEVITANILAGPLRQLAPDLAHALSPGGILVLSGFLTWQEASVFAAYRNRGLSRLRRFVVGDWVTLMLIQN